jgi:hypothetical protein
VAYGVNEIKADDTGKTINKKALAPGSFWPERECFVFAGCYSARSSWGVK